MIPVASGPKSLFTAYNKVRVAKQDAGSSKVCSGLDVERHIVHKHMRCHHRLQVCGPMGVISIIH